MENAIHIIGEALKNYIAQAPSIFENEINSIMPKKRWVDSPSTDNPKVNIYLFDIKENLELRENEWQTVRYPDGSIQKKRPDIRIDLFYIITFYGQQTELVNAIKEEHQYLAEVLPIVYRYDEIPTESFIDEDGNPISGVPTIPITVMRPKFLEGEGGVQLWSAIEQYIKPAIYIKVTIPINLKQIIEELMVLSKIVNYGFYKNNIHIPTEDKNINFAGIITNNATPPIPITGATVKLYTTENINGVSTERLVDTYSTNEEGQFVFRKLNNQAYRVKVSARKQGYKSKRKRFKDLLKIEKNECIISLDSAT